MYVLAGFLIVGFICNLLVRPLASRWFMSDAQVVEAQGHGQTAAMATGSQGIGKGGFTPAIVIPWLLVGLPILWGVYITFGKAVVLFK
jgi:hypothetical protein